MPLWERRSVYGVGLGMEMDQERDKEDMSRSSSFEHDFDRTISIGERAIGYLKQFRTPAIPRNYEIFYVHTTGYNKGLSEAICKAIEKHSCLTEEDAERIYQEHLHPAEYPEQIDKIGRQVTGQIKDIIGSVAAACKRTSSFTESLNGLSDQAGQIKSPGQLKIVINKLVMSGNEMVGHNSDLEMKLADARKQIEQLHQSLETTRAESLTDQLTGLSNRKRFDQLLEMEMIEADGSDDPLCVMLLDIDHFKSFNDTYGHQTGDQVLGLVSMMIKTSVKGGDHTARYGGEEFSIVLPKTTLKGGLIIAERIRSAIRAKELIKKSTGKSLGQITMSIGIARYRPGETSADLVARADICLYAAKKAGRDNVKCETDPEIDSETEAA